MDQKDKYFVYPWTMQMRLPIIEIPLVPDDPTVKVDLQPILDECYDKGIYERRVHYRTKKKWPTLTKDQKAWAEKHLKAARV
jgi:hypothetical protein